jgi:LuxR family maltose regulon positive regulatory protein
MTAIGAAAPQAIAGRARTRITPRPAAVTDGLAAPLDAPGFVARDALVERLIAAQGASLAMLVAPAGYGKSTLLTEWAARDPRPFAWVRLERVDDDPFELARSLARALARVVPELRELEVVATKRRRSVDTLARSLGQALGAVDAPFVVVLEDSQLLRSAASFELLEQLVGSLRRGSQIALASRRQPPLRVARLRTERRMFELRPADLVLTRSEVGAVAAAAGLALDDDACELLAQRTEGWPAGVYLAALAVRDDPNPERALAAFGGDDRLVVEYVRDELLSGLPADVIGFLARSSILPRLSGPLCDYVLERQDSARLLRKLSQMNVLVVPLDRTDTEYRYHGLLAQALRAELRLREPELEAPLHARASEWHELQGKRAPAIEHAIHAHDLERAGSLLWEATPQLLGYGQTAVLAQRLSHFSPEQIAACAPLALSAAGLQLALGDRALAEHWTATAERIPSLDASARTGLHVLRAAVAGDIAAMRREAARAYELAPEENPWCSLACLLEGMALRLQNDAAGAGRRLEEGARRGVAVAPAMQVLCLTQLALLAIDEGDWDAAEARIAIARAQVDRVGLTDFPMAALVFAVSAAVSAHLSRPDAAERDARQADRLLDGLAGFIPWYNAQCRIALAWAAVRVSDTGRAQKLLAEAARDLRDLPDDSAAHTSLKACREQAEVASAARPADAEQLTTAELRVLHFLPTHLSFPEIADQLYVSRNTVKTHVRAVYRKLTASSRSEAVEHARDAGLIDRLAA